MRIATWNINGINGRIDLLTGWLKRFKPDVVCLQELKAPDTAFPASAIDKAGYGAIWHGQQRWNGVAILARGTDPVEAGRGLPGDPDDDQSRYLEAAVDGHIIACLYLPNGNPWPGPKFDYKLKWMDRFAKRAKALFKLDAPVILAGDYNVIPTDADVYKPERWAKDALFAPEAKARYAKLLKAGWVDAIRTLHPDKVPFTFWPYWRQSFERDAGIRIDHFLLNPPAAKTLKKGGVDRGPRGEPHPSDHAPVWIELA